MSKKENIITSTKVLKLIEDKLVYLIQEATFSHEVKITVYEIILNVIKETALELLELSESSVKREKKKNATKVFLPLIKKEG